MQRYLENLKNPKVAAGIGLLLGLIIGWFVLGWGLFPVQWTDAAPSHLRTDYKLDYLRMTITGFLEDDNEDMALLRWRVIGEEAPDLLSELKMDGSVDPKGLMEFESLVGAGADVSGGEMAQPQPEEAAGGGQEEPARQGPNGLMILLILCPVTAIIGGAMAYVLLLRKRKTRIRQSAVGQGEEDSSPGDDVPKTEEIEDMDSAVGRFTTSYVAGDDIYDDSYSIDSHSGEFLGECGVTISESLTSDEPKKVNALEIWLFDKDDIQTITKVLLSEHSYNDTAFRQRMMSKGEPVLVQPGSQILLETESLQLEAHVVDLKYGISTLPENSYFERLSIELSVWMKK